MIPKEAYATFFINKIHRIWCLIQEVWATLREIIGENDGETKISDLNDVVVAGMSVVMRKHGEKRVWGKEGDDYARFCNEGLWWRDRQLDTESGR